MTIVVVQHFRSFDTNKYESSESISCFDSRVYLECFIYCKYPGKGCPQKPWHFEPVDASLSPPSFFSLTHSLSLSLTHTHRDAWTLTLNILGSGANPWVLSQQATHTWASAWWEWLSPAWLGLFWLSVGTEPNGCIKKCERKSRTEIKRWTKLLCE